MSRLISNVALLAVVAVPGTVFAELPGFCTPKRSGVCSTVRKCCDKARKCCDKARSCVPRPDCNIRSKACALKQKLACFVPQPRLCVPDYKRICPQKDCCSSKCTQPACRGSECRSQGCCTHRRHAATNQSVRQPSESQLRQVLTQAQGSVRSQLQTGIRLDAFRSNDAVRAASDRQRLAERQERRPSTIQMTSAQRSRQVSRRPTAAELDRALTELETEVAALKAQVQRNRNR